MVYKWAKRFINGPSGLQTGWTVYKPLIRHHWYSHGKIKGQRAEIGI